MDKSWINSKERTSVEYMQGIIKFISFAYEKSSPDDHILCPCRKCINAFWRSKDDVVEHLLCNGFQKSYIQWTYHGEVSNPSTSNANDNDACFGNDIPTLLEDAFHQVGIDGEDNADVEDSNDHVEDDLNASSVKDTSHCRMEKGSEKISELMRNSDKPLYDNCIESKLAAVLYLYHLKCLNGWSNSSFTQLLDYLSFLLPKGNKLPKSHHEVKSMVSVLGLSYEKIHACRNGCMLFWKNNENAELCNICGESRWKGSKQDDDLLTDHSVVKQRRKPMNVLRWFPLKPRLQWLFMCSKTSGDMRWHETSIKDGLLRHPMDSLAWKEFDLKHPCFAGEPRNIRLGLAADGLNPFKNMNVSHSTWPIILIPYNLPPWICMKQTNFILSLLIPGPKAPGDKIDIYMQPLIDELKELWDSGIETFDASKNESFIMRAALLWTLNDFPAYGSLSGWSVRGEKACPVCGQYTDSRWLTHSRKYCYMGHRRWLHPNHNTVLTLAGIWLTTKHRKEAEGATPSRADIYIATRKRKDGTAINEKAKELMELMEKHQEIKKIVISNDASSWQGDAYSLVKGSERKGIIRCLGPIAPSSTFATTSSSSNEKIQSTLNGVLDLLAGVVQMCKDQHPNANIESLMQTARDLSSQIRAAPGKAQASKGASTSSDMHNKKGSSSSHNP